MSRPASRSRVAPDPPATKPRAINAVDPGLDRLSKGNQQRVQFIAAVLHCPAVAVLDEPFSGLDPLSQEFFLDLVGEMKREGTTILLSANQMDPGRTRRRSGAAPQPRP